MSCGVGHRRGLDPSLLGLWHRPVATALIRPLAWELPYAAGAALKTKKGKRKKKKGILSKTNKGMWSPAVLCYDSTTPAAEVHVSCFKNDFDKLKLVPKKAVGCEGQLTVLWKRSLIQRGIN